MKNPKEEPKQRLEKYSERFDNDKSTIGNPHTWGKRIVEEPKKETLEEAELNTMLKEATNQTTCASERMGFMVGAKWQAERNYSEEDMFDCWKASHTGGLDDDSLRAHFNHWFEQFKKK
jgi:hypothetical protein